jgi:threonine/homoserine/homoserine lactone efflux protein
MWTALADVLPYTTGLVLTPFALIAVIVLLVSDNGTRKGLVLVAIWLVATLVVCLAVAEIATGAEREADDKGIWIGLLRLLIGIVLLMLTIGMIRQAARRPVEEPRKPPGRLEAADRSSLPQIAGASLVLAVANPANLSMLIGAGVTLGAVVIAGYRGDPAVR